MKGMDKENGEEIMVVIRKREGRISVMIGLVEEGRRREGISRGRLIPSLQGPHGSLNCNTSKINTFNI